MTAARSVAALRQGAFIEDPAAQTEAGRKAFLGKCEREADPEAQLSAEERAKRAQRLRRANLKKTGPKVPKPTVLEDLSAEEIAHAMNSLERRGLIGQSCTGSYVQATPDLMALTEQPDDAIGGSIAP